MVDENRRYIIFDEAYSTKVYKIRRDKIDSKHNIIIYCVVFVSFYTGVDNIHQLNEYICFFWFFLFAITKNSKLYISHVALEIS